MPDLDWNNLIPQIIASALSIVGVFITIGYTEHVRREDARANEAQRAEDARVSVLPYIALSPMNFFHSPTVASESSHKGEIDTEHSTLHSLVKTEGIYLIIRAGRPTFESWLTGPERDYFDTNGVLFAKGECFVMAGNTFTCAPFSLVNVGQGTAINATAWISHVTPRRVGSRPSSPRTIASGQAFPIGFCVDTSDTSNHGDYDFAVRYFDLACREYEQIFKISIGAAYSRTDELCDNIYVGFEGNQTLIGE